MKKIKFYNSKKEIKNIKEDVNDKIKTLNYKVESLEAKLHKVTYPNGLIDVRWHGWNSYYYAGIEYAYNDKILQSHLFTEREDLEYESYKSIIKDDKIFIGLKFKNTAKYFIVDMRDKKSIECTDNNMIDKTEWIKVK